MLTVLVLSHFPSRAESRTPGRRRAGVRRGCDTKKGDRLQPMGTGQGMKRQERKRVAIRTELPCQPAVWHMVLELSAVGAGKGEGKAPRPPHQPNPTVARLLNHRPALRLGLGGSCIPVQGGKAWIS